MDKNSCLTDEMQKYEDSVLVDLVQNGQLEAYEALMHKYQALVYHLCYRLMRNKQDAEEMAQDTFVKAFQKINDFEGKSKLSTWLYTIAYRTCLNKLKIKGLPLVDSSSEEMEPEDDNEWEQVLTTIDDQKLYAQVHLLLEQLDFEDRALLTFYYFDDLSIKEISAINGYSESNVKVKLFRARKQFKNLMESNLMVKEWRNYGG